MPVGAVAADQPVPSEPPDVAERRGRALRGLWRLVRVGQALGRRIEEPREFVHLEAHQAQVEAVRAQIAELHPEHLGVPARALGQLVVGEDERPLLRLGQMRELDDGDLFEAELARRHHPTVPDDDPVRAVDQHRVREAELADRAGDQRHLGVGMRAGIARVGDQARDRPVRDPQPEPRELVRRPDRRIHVRLRSWSTDLAGSAADTRR